MDEITNGFNGRLFHLSKAFDTVNHSILLEKLHLFGDKGKKPQLFQSYLPHRKQYIVSNKESTCCEIIMCGVPQSSICIYRILMHAFVDYITSLT